MSTTKQGPDDMSEEQLVEQAKTDAQAFGRLYDRYYSQISNYILRRVTDIPVAQDLTSNVFFKAMGHLGRFEWRGLPFSAWLYRIAANEIAGYFRRQHHHPLSLDELYAEHQFEPAGQSNPEHEVLQTEAQAEQYKNFRLVQALLGQLPVKQQEILALRYFEKKSLKDIAVITGINLNTVKSHLARGTARLKTLYAQAAQAAEVQPPAPHRVIKAEE